MNPKVEKETSGTLRAAPAREPFLVATDPPVRAHADLKPTAKLAAAMEQATIGPFKTKQALFDALEANEG